MFLAREMQLKPSHARRGWEYYTQHQIWHPDGDLSLKGTEVCHPDLHGSGWRQGTNSPVWRKYVDQTYLNEALKDLPRDSLSSDPWWRGQTGVGHCE